eukprot:CAMPEP_0195532896 /NCGR_PEP_ID=MMETSP0794_2-20130614/39329_1 /TAXON_ID=515487 /ORGANISM="Stephanopyxis turris, Strain CCMP 815" /LENGTH=56 /DNA_ID=CAMNT_0040665273 /DNA_START=44 /DNA_END=211 /DNA_ORIENTATION=-
MSPDTKQTTHVPSYVSTKHLGTNPVTHAPSKAYKEVEDSNNGNGGLENGEAKKEKG